MATIPNAASTEQGADGQVIQLSHQSDTSSDGKAARGHGRGGRRASPRRGATRAPSGKIGGAHFWNLDAAPAHKLGSWLYPNPVLAPGSARAGAGLDRPHRACVHDPRLPERRQRRRRARARSPRASTASRACPAGSSSPPTTAPARGGSTSPSAVQLDRRHRRGLALDLGEHARLERHAGRRDLVGEGVQGLRLHGRHGARLRRLLAHELRRRGLPRPADEHARPCEGRRRRGGRRRRALDPVRPVEGRQRELLARRQRTWPARPRRPASSRSTTRRPTGRSTATAIDSLTIAASKASITGRATVDGVPGVSFFVEAEDVASGADSFRIVLGDGYAAGGVLTKGKVEVTGGLVASLP